MGLLLNTYLYTSSLSVRY